MRHTYPIAAAAASLALLSGAQALAGNEQNYYTITLTEGRLSAAQPATTGSTAKVDSFTVKQGVKPYHQYKLDRVFVKSWSTSGDADAPPTGTSGLTMKRGTGPVPASDGISRLIAVTQLKGGCQVGKRFSSAIVEGGGKRYQLSDLTIADCARTAGPEEQITFVYGKMVVK